MSMTTAETHRPKPPAFMWRAWETMQAENIGYLFLGRRGTEKATLPPYRQRPYGAGSPVSAGQTFATITG